MAARFHVPMRTFAELLRLSYFETLRREGLSQAAVGERLGQTARHMRTLASNTEQDLQLDTTPGRRTLRLRHQAVRSHQCARCGLVWSGSIWSYTRHQVISYSIGEISSSWRC